MTPEARAIDTRLREAILDVVRPRILSGEIETSWFRRMRWEEPDPPMKVETARYTDRWYVSVRVMAGAFLATGCWSEPGASEQAALEGALNFYRMGGSGK